MATDGEVRAALTFENARVNELAKLLQGAGEWPQEAVVRHRRVLKRIGRVGSDPSEQRRALSEARLLAADYSLRLADLGIALRAEEPDGRPTTVGPYSSDVPPALPNRGAVVGYRDMPKTEVDARIRATLVAPYLSGAVESADRCAANWRAMMQGQPTPDEMFGKLMSLPDGAADKYPRLSGRSIRRWAESVRKAEVVRPPESSPVDRAAVLRHTQPPHRKVPRKVTGEIRRQVHSLFLSDRKDWTAANIAEFIRLTHDIQVSDRRVQQIIADEIPSAIRLMERGGPAAADQYLRQQLLREAPHPNHTWQMDHTWVVLQSQEQPHPDNYLGLDAIVTDYNRGGFPSRRRVGVHATIIMDAASRRRLGTRLWPRVPTAREVLVMLWDAIGRFGTPQILYNDNGADFRSNTVVNALQRAGINNVVSLPYQPEGRGKIEVGFKTLKQAVMPFLAGWGGHHNAPKWKLDELHSLAELEAKLQLGVEYLLNHRPHQMTGRVPVEHYNEAVGTLGFPPAPDKLLDLLMAKDDLVRHDYGIVLNSKRYSSARLAAVPVGTRVRAYYDPFRDDRLHIAVPRGGGAFEYLGVAQRYGPDAPPPHQSTVTTQEAKFIDEIKAEFAAYLKGATHSRKSERDTADVDKHEKVLLEQVREMKALPPPIDPPVKAPDVAPSHSSLDVNLFDY